MHFVFKDFLSTTTGGHCTSSQPPPSSFPTFFFFSSICHSFMNISIFDHIKPLLFTHTLITAPQATFWDKLPADNRHKPAAKLKTNTSYTTSNHNHMDLTLAHTGLLQSGAEILSCTHDSRLPEVTSFVVMKVDALLIFFFFLQTTKCTSVILTHTRHTESRARRICRKAPPPRLSAALMLIRTDGSGMFSSSSPL